MRTTTIRAILCGFLLAVALTGGAVAQKSEQEARLLVLEHLWNEAQVNRDAAALDALVSSQFVNTEFDGEVSNKEQFLEEIRDPQFKPATMNVQNMKVIFYHDTAIVIGDYHAKGTYQGRPYDHSGRFTDTWFLQNGSWQCIASHSSLVRK
ncbi:MAG TPA: nuclear transport factor 2 family protein [Candidatus Aquilonibacter sp.]|nr:nuclear transport factor 2 family protein [Candidatus Aquilonibacter sp.]